MGEQTETPESQEQEPGYDLGSVIGLGHPDEPEGEPAVAEAVETSEDPAAPEAAPDTESAESAETPPEASEDKPEPEQTVNFDGFSDEQKTTWERLLKDGHVTSEEVERARSESLMQRAFTKKTMTLAEQRKALDAEYEEFREDRGLLAKIREDDRLHAAWLKLSAEGVGGSEASDDADELVDARKAAEIADKRYEQREAERAQRTSAEQKAYSQKRDAIAEVVNETIATLGVKPETMKAYLEAEEATLPANVDPILHLAPEEIQRRILMRHELETAKAETARLRELHSQRTSKAARTAKQSLPPAPRIAHETPKSLMQQLKGDLGLDPDKPLSGQVAGLGFPS